MFDKILAEGIVAHKRGYSSEIFTVIPSQRRATVLYCIFLGRLNGWRQIESDREEICSDGVRE